MKIILHGWAIQIGLFSIFKVVLTSWGEGAALPPLDLLPQMAVHIGFEGNANAGKKGWSIKLMIAFIGQLVNIKMMVEATAVSNCGAVRPAACWMGIYFNRTQSTTFPSFYFPAFLFPSFFPPYFFLSVTITPPPPPPPPPALSPLFLPFTSKLLYFYVVVFVELMLMVWYRLTEAELRNVFLE